jgi:hypothetical protein
MKLGVGIFCLVVSLLVAHHAAAAHRPIQSTCTQPTAEKTTVLEFLKHPRHFEGRCILISGIVGGRSIYDNLPALYAHFTRRDDNPEPHYVALYSHKQDLEEQLWSVRANMQVVGVATTCDSMYKRAEKEVAKANAEAKRTGSGVESIVFMKGQCHYDSGPVIQVDEAFPLLGKTRLTGEDARAKYGDAFVIRTPRESARQTIDSLLAALRKHDASLLAGKVKDFGDELSSDALFDAEKSPYRFLLGAPNAPQIAYFDIHAQLDYLYPNTIAVACICKQNDCSKEWQSTATD